jgi:hypothetical protein
MKKHLHKTINILGLILLLAFSTNCNKDDENENIYGTWVLKSFQYSLSLPSGYHESFSYDGQNYTKRVAGGVAYDEYTVDTGTGTFEITFNKNNTLVFNELYTFLETYYNYEHSDLKFYSTSGGGTWKKNLLLISINCNNSFFLFNDEHPLAVIISSQNEMHLEYNTKEQEISYVFERKQ